MLYLLMTVSIIFSVLCSCFLHQYSDRRSPDDVNVFFFNAGVSLIWCPILGILFLSGSRSIQPQTVIFGCIYGIILCMFLLFKTQSMSKGPVSLSTLVGGGSFIITTLYSVYLREPISLFQIIGILLLLIALFLCVNPKKSKEPLTPTWFISCFFFFLFGGGVGILYKEFDRSAVFSELNAMMLIAAFVSALCFLFIGCISAHKKGDSEKLSRRTILFILLAGITSCVYQRLNVFLAAKIPSPIFFPVANGSMIVLSTVAGKLFFGERLKPIQLLGIILGFIAILITGCGEALYTYYFA